MNTPLHKRLDGRDIIACMKSENFEDIKHLVDPEDLEEFYDIYTIISFRWLEAIEGLEDIECDIE